MSCREEVRERVSGKWPCPAEEREVALSLSRLRLMEEEAASLEEAVEEVVSSVAFLARAGRIRVDDVGCMVVIELHALGWL